MMNARTAIDSGWSFIEGKLRAISTKLNAPFKDVSFPPEVQNALFYLREIHLAAYRLEHRILFT